MCACVIPNFLLQVPPLRISLPRTASEDSTAAINSEDGGSVAAGTRNGKRNARFIRTQIKKEATPDAEQTPPPDGVHRMTRFAS